ncbi:hypothetical protein P308_15830 [Pseudomonas piscis]|nr:hypothetical protein P308_15830 [Pseudomonas piscis]
MNDLEKTNLSYGLRRKFSAISAYQSAFSATFLSSSKGIVYTFDPMCLRLRTGLSRSDLWI